MSIQIQWTGNRTRDPCNSNQELYHCATQGDIHAPSDHDYCSYGNEKAHPQTCNAECQTNLTLQDMEKSEAELLQLRETFRDKDDLKRYLLVYKMTDSDSSVKSYFGLPSVVTLFGIFAILDNLTPTLAYWKGGSGVYNATPENPSKKTGPNRKLTRFHEFLITLLRLRLALPTFVIADIFWDFMHWSVTNCCYLD